MQTIPPPSSPKKAAANTVAADAKKAIAERKAEAKAKAVAAKKAADAKKKAAAKKLDAAKKIVAKRQAAADKKVAVARKKDAAKKLAEAKKAVAAKKVRRAGVVKTEKAVEVDPANLSASDAQKRVGEIYRAQRLLESKVKLHEVSKLRAKLSKKALDAAKEALEQLIHEQRFGPGPLFDPSGKGAANA